MVPELCNFISGHVVLDDFAEPVTFYPWIVQNTISVQHKRLVSYLFHYIRHAI
jgi:hypothetical protein